MKRGSNERNDTARGVRPLLLLSNDDGIASAGLKRLYDAFSKAASVIVAAPDRERSGVGHAFTFNTPLHYEKTTLGDAVEGYCVSGTPVDCVKFAISFLLPRRPDIVIAGLNRGENSGLSAFYSGTVAAAREGAFWDIPSFAFSVCEEGEAYAEDYAGMAPDIVRRMLARSRSPRKGSRIYYNVNFPRCRPSEARGIKITRQSMAFFDDRYETVDVEAHHTKKGYVIYGEKKDVEPSDDYDSRALMNGYITVTPLGFDATAHCECNDRSRPRKRKVRRRGQR